MPDLTIGRVARNAGVGVETIRFYERSRLIDRPPKPRFSGFRVYDTETVERIRFIRQAQDLGFSLREIRELLSLRAVPSTDCSAVRAQAVAKRDEVERKLRELARIGQALDELIAACPGRGALHACTILEAMRTRPAKSTAHANGAARRRPVAMRARRGSIQGYAMKTTTLKVDGMHCEGCAQTLQFLIGREAGVQKVTVSFKDHEARIMHEPNVVGEDRIATIIKRAGYRVASSR